MPGGAALTRPDDGSYSVLSRSSTSKSQISPIWEAAIHRYYAELERGGIKTPALDRTLWDIDSPKALLDEIQSMVPQESQITRVWTTVLPRLEPVLLGLNDFAAVIAWSLGMNGRVAAVLWGSMRLILKYAQPVLPALLDMLEQLRLVLPKARLYEQELPLTDTLENALLDMYTEIIVFYAHTIAFFRNNPNVAQSRNAWSQFSSDFAKVLDNLRKYSRRVDEIADMIRLSKETHSAETVVAINNLKTIMFKDDSLSCYMIPYGLNLRFFGRSDETHALRSALDPPAEATGLRVIAICGLGGVGKTQLALNYANTSMQSFDVIAWIHADTQSKMVQSLASFATKLGLPKDGEIEDNYQSVQKVRDWLNASRKSFLLIFDNVEDVNILDQVWPSNDKGSIIITSRSPAIASSRATNILQLDCFSENTAVDVLAALTGTKKSEGVAAAKEICQLLGYFPLAMVQMSSFIRNRGCSFEEFLVLFKKFTSKIISKSDPLLEYDLTLSTVWNLSLESLSPKSRNLLNLLAFFDPDVILERLLINSKYKSTDRRLEALEDEFEFAEAVIELTKSSLVSRSASSKSLTIHRLVQLAVLERLMGDEMTFYFDTAYKLLYHDFPNTWNQIENNQGHGFQSWETCSAIVPHVNRLVKIKVVHDVKITELEVFAELIFRIGTYLWENEQPTTSQALFQYGLSITDNLPIRLAAQAHRLLGHIALDIAHPRVALSSYEKALMLREKFEEPESLGIAQVLDSIACSMTEIGDWEKALEQLHKAESISLARQNRKSSRTEFIYSMTYLKANQLDKALDRLHNCWMLQGKTQEEIAQSQYPKHPGDIVLLGRIRYAEGTDEARKEGLQLVSQSISLRRGIFGAKGPRVADSIFHVSLMMAGQNEYNIAAKMLSEVVDMSRGMEEMQCQLTRALWFLGSFEDELSNPEGARKYRDEAKRERLKLTDREVPDEDTDAGFLGLVTWMLL